MLKPGITLYFVRHGETDWNLAGRYQGQRDIPLNATGRAQAARNGRVLGEFLAGRSASLDFVASPLARATETMQILRREMGLDPGGFHTDDRLKEMHYGHWEGQLWTELPTLDPEGFAARKADLWAWQPLGGESYRLLSERIATWLADVNKSSVVVAHGGVSRALRGHVGKLQPSAIPLLEVPQDKVLVLTAEAISWL
jgi:probable phosphoglycerate mutase